MLNLQILRMAWTDAKTWVIGQLLSILAAGSPLW